MGDTIFEPYVRGRNSNQPGIGLGLATVRRIVESHRGRVGVQSRPGCTCFWFELPKA
jgi:signal transduction histidine kinase